MSKPTSTESAAVPSEQNPLAGGCPVAHHGSSSSAGAPTNKLAGGCPVGHGGAKEPKSNDISHSAAGSSSKHPFQMAHKNNPSDSSAAALPPSGEEVPANSIPAAGRGNSDDGKEWLNPSANQLFRALARKDKPIEPADAGAVAAVHVAVTDNTWSCIMEYEKLHAASCPKPTLARFQGMDGIFSIKAKVMSSLWGVRPFDRHDWYVNRCGKEVKYVIDYYSFETPDPKTGETAIDYFIDARPAPTLAGLYDRARVAFGKWKKGERIW